jgi:long-chain acyl-CoA synthetase
MNVRAPWLSSYGHVPKSLDYPDAALSAPVLDVCDRYGGLTAYDFLGARVSFRDFGQKLRECARAFAALGVAPGERVSICMPNTPQAVIAFYALNMIGAVAVMLHPLSSEEELVSYINSSRSVAVLTLDQFAPKLEAIAERVCVKHVIVSAVDDALTPPLALGYRLTEGRGIKRCAPHGIFVRYKTFLRLGGTHTGEYRAKTRGEDVAVILYSGGTSGRTKGIMLTNLNLNALAMQTAAAGDCIVPGNKMLAIMPIFHGFGLGVCVHTALMHAVTCILVPRFSISSYAKLLKRYKPNYIAGVPTLFEALFRLDGAKKLDLRCLLGVFSGGDTLKVDLKRSADAFLREHGASVQIREGYGLTECVTASCLTPKDSYREGSIGLPFPDTFYKIVSVGTPDELPYGETGEICISGPTVMRGYDNDPDGTADVLRTHPDGRLWLHTGDLGEIDGDGYVYFRGRAKRMIISSGYSVYPSYVEEALEKHADIERCCIVGVPDDYRMQRIKAFIVLRDGLTPTEEVLASIKLYCERNVAPYARPREYVFRAELPMTALGKVAYRELEEL